VSIYETSPRAQSSAVASVKCQYKRNAILRRPDSSSSLHHAAPRRIVVVDPVGVQSRRKNTVLSVQCNMLVALALRSQPTPGRYGASTAYCCTRLGGTGTLVRTDRTPTRRYLHRECRATPDDDSYSLVRHRRLYHYSADYTAMAGQRYGRLRDSPEYL
jgi:hypothetical protein